MLLPQWVVDLEALCLHTSDLWRNQVMLLYSHFITSVSAGDATKLRLIRLQLAPDPNSLLFL